MRKSRRLAWSSGQSRRPDSGARLTLGREAARIRGASPPAVLAWSVRAHRPALKVLAPRPGFCHIPDPLPNPSEAVQCKPLEVAVGEKGIERAIKHLKRKMAAEGILRELKRRRHHMKPSVKRRKKMSEAARRRRKRQRIEGQ